MSDIGDKFRWVTYNYDGGSVSQVTPNGEKNSYEDLDLSNIKSFELWDWRANQRVLLVNFNPGDRLVWRRRIQNSGYGPEEVCHIVGKVTRAGEKGILGIFESDGHIEAIGDFLPTSNWFYPPSSEIEETGDAQVS